MKLIPYAQVDGAWSVRDADVKHCWRKMEEEGTARIVFWSGSVKTEDDFLAMCKAPANIVVFVISDTDFLGLAWLNEVSGNHAMAHFCFFRDSWGTDSIEMGEMVLSYWFSFEYEGEPVLKVIIGNVPDFNVKALSFIRKLGFIRVGEIPHIAGGNAMTVNYLERDDGR